MTLSTSRLAGRASIASGLLGGIALGCLVWYISTPAIQMQESGSIAPLGRLLTRINFAGATLQALLMIPVAVHLAALGSPRAANRSVLTVGIAAFAAVALLRLAIFFNPALSDILFTAPMGFIGLWLIAVNCLLKGALSHALRRTGVIAGIGLFIMGVNFFVNGGIAEFTHPYAYGLSRNFHIGLALSFPGLALFPVWSILLGFKLASLN